MLRKEFLRQSNPYALDTGKYAQELSDPFKCNAARGYCFPRHMVDRFFDVPDGFLGVTANMVGLLLL